MTEHDAANTEPDATEPALTAPGADASAPKPSPAPSPRAQAASRARRIGGRPLPSGAPRPGAPAPTPNPAAVDLAKRDEPLAEATGDLDTDIGLADTTAADTAPDDTAPDDTAPDDTAPDDTAPDDTAPAPPRPAPPWLKWLPTGLLAAGVVAVLTIGVLVSHGTWWDKKTVNVGAQRGQVVAAAKSCMATMNSYAYNKLDAAEAKGLACTTGALTAQYKSAMEKVIKPQAAKVKFTQSAQVNNAGVESVSKDGKQWVVLVFGQLATTDNTTTANAPKLSIFSARVTMQQVKGHWLVSDYQYAPNS
jgi:hypothetical protein